MVANLTTVIQSATVAIGVLSLVLSYISHRYSAFDSPYERESKIDDKMEKIPTGVGEFSSEDYPLKINYIKSTVYEDKLSLRGWGFLFPRANIQGQTQLSFSIDSTNEFETELTPGYYVGDTADYDTLLSAVGINIEPDTGGLLHVMIDSANVNEVGRSVSDMESIDYDLEDNRGKYTEIFNSDFE